MNRFLKTHIVINKVYISSRCANCANWSFHEEWSIHVHIEGIDHW